jgi:hypothetical protein
MKIAILILTILFSLSSYSAEYKTCNWNGNKKKFVVPNNETVELIQDALKVRAITPEKIKELEEIILSEELSSSAVNPSVCDLVSKNYRVSSDKCKKTFGTNAFLFLMNSNTNAVIGPDLTCKIGLNISLLFY